MYLQEILKPILKQIEKENVSLIKFMEVTLNLNKRKKIKIHPVKSTYPYNKCECKTKTKSLSIKQSVGKPLPYPYRITIKNKEAIFKTFQIKYNEELCLTSKSLLNSFQNKYLYYAIDDILYLLKSNSIEKSNLLTILYSPVIFLQNNFSVNFFDIWIHGIYINDIAKKNKFLKNNHKSFSYITIELFYILPIPIKKQETIW